MDYTRQLYERAGGYEPGVGGREQHSGMQSVQNLETVINEGLRVALLEETPDQSLEVLLEHLGKALHGERSRKREIFRMFPRRCVRAGIRSSA